jgi:hypothetical protein
MPPAVSNATDDGVSDFPYGAAMSTSPGSSETIVLVHGFWGTPRSWDGWIDHYGSEDHITPPSVQRSNAKHDKGKATVTEVREYPGRADLMTSQEGWQEIADDVLDWALEHAVRS